MAEKYRILITEDRSDDRLLLRKIVESMGYDVLEAVDGQEGLEMARIHKPDLIISDGLMPKMDGFCFLRNIAKDKELSNIPFIFYSAVYHYDKDTKLAIALGARAFIEKPIEPTVFMDKLKSIIQENKEKGGPKPVVLIEEEEEYLKRYSEVVATKLEEKVVELEKVNENLQQEIIKRNQTEEELNKYRVHLEEMVEERTAELEEKNKELKEYNKMFVNREFRIKELRDIVEELKEKK